MKKASRFLFVLSIIFPTLLFSCSDDVSPDIEIERGEKGDAYFSVSLLTSPVKSSTTTRANDEKLIHAWEHRVENVWMLLYNDSDILEYKFDLAVSNYANDELIVFENTNQSDSAILTSSSDKLKFQTVAKLIKKQKYKLIVLVNPAHALQQLNLNIGIGPGEDKSLNSLIQVLGSASSPLKIETFGGYSQTASPFFMSNANGIVTIPESGLQLTKEEAENTPIKVKVDRLLAKIVVNEHKNGVTLRTGDRLDSLKWCPDVVNKKSFLIRQYADYANGNPETEATSSTTDRGIIYATDPNFSGGQLAEFSRLGDGTHSPLLTHWNKKGSTTFPEYQYVFENTLELNAQKQNEWGNYTTQAVVHAYIIHTDFLVGNSVNDPGLSYYSYNAGTPASPELKVFTHEQVRLWLERGFPSEMSGLLAKVNDNISAKNSGSTDCFDFKSSIQPSFVNEVKTFFGISFHPKGLNIYRIPIKHFVNDQLTNPREQLYGHYGVVRNNVYTINVRSISGPGTGVEWDSHFISTEVGVTPWYLRDFQNDVHVGYDD